MDNPFDELAKDVARGVPKRELLQRLARRSLKPVVDQRLDRHAAAKLLGGTMPRRELLHRLAVGMAGSFLASLGLAERAEAQSSKRRCENYCKGVCTPTGPGCTGKLQQPCFQSCVQTCIPCGDRTAAVCGTGGSTCTGPATFICADLRGDEQNCGACGNVCASPKECMNGLCVCPSTLITCPGPGNTTVCCASSKSCRGGACTQDTDCCNGACVGGVCCSPEATCSSAGADFCCDPGKVCTPHVNSTASPDACCPSGTAVACDGVCCQAGESCVFDQFADFGRQYVCCPPGTPGTANGVCCPPGGICSSSTRDFCCDPGKVCTPNTNSTTSPDACCVPGTAIACEGVCCQGSCVFNASAPFGQQYTCQTAG